jgi:hypothetical protein
MQKYNWKKIALIILLFLTPIIFILATREKRPEPTMPIASPLPSAPLPKDELEAVKKIDWGSVTLPETKEELFLYRVSSPYPSSENAKALASLFGYNEAEITTFTQNQKTWSNDSGILATSTSPQYVQFTSLAQEGHSVSIGEVQAVLSSSGSLAIGSPSSGVQKMQDPESGTIISTPILTYSITQKIGSYNVITQSSKDLGTIVFNQKTSGLLSITISGGFSAAGKLGSALPLSLEEIKSRAETSAIWIGENVNISERKKFLSSEQKIAMTNIDLVYYHDLNRTEIVPGYLLTGRNQESKEVSYFLPIL